MKKKKPEKVHLLRVLLCASQQLKQSHKGGISCQCCSWGDCVWFSHHDLSNKALSLAALDLIYRFIDLWHFHGRSVYCALLLPFLLPSLKMTQNELQMQLLDVRLNPCLTYLYYILFVLCPPHTHLLLQRFECSTFEKQLQAKLTHFCGITVASFHCWC